MRNNIIHPNADALIYEIREIVEVANKIEKTGLPIVWENIGDPVAKGEKVVQWMRDMVAETLKNDVSSFGYSPTKGLLETREFIATARSSEGGIHITPDDILFFNGLGDGVATIYSCLHKDARIIGPNPIYPAHSSSESFHAGAPYISFHLDPRNHWYPDINDLENQIQKHPEISGILIINPDNPTGVVYSREVMKQIVDIAKKYDLFIIADEVYANLCYGGVKHTSLASVIGDVPGMALRGVSKEFPWPGARCGWVEFYNSQKDPVFAKYVKTIMDAKMLEVCATTLPQKMMPKIMNDPRYLPHIKERNELYWKKSQLAYTIFSQIPELIIHKAYSAFYMAVVFKDGVLHKGQSLKPANAKTTKIIKPLLESKKLDKCFVYHLLASRGICVVPLSSGFHSDLYGFRLTLLEQNMEQFEKTINTIALAIKEYIAS